MSVIVFKISQNLGRRRLIFFPKLRDWSPDIVALWFYSTKSPETFTFTVK